MDLIAHWLVLSQKFLIHTDASYSLSQGFWDVLQWLQKAELWVLVWVQLSSNVKIKKYKALITLHASGLLHGTMPRSSLLHITNLTFSAMCYRGKLHIIFRDVKLRPHHDFPVVENIDWQTKLTFQQVAQWLYLVLWVGLRSNVKFFKSWNIYAELLTTSWLLANDSLLLHQRPVRARTPYIIIKALRMVWSTVRWICSIC